MHKVIVMSILVAALSVLSSCRSDGRAEGVLRLADSLMEQRPDSSLALLRRDSLLFAGASKAVRMAYVVSRTEAEDKLYMPHRSDSAVLRAAQYFSSRGPELQRVRSWYLLGRVYCDMLLYGHALSAFDKALDGEATADSSVCRYKARACTWAGAVYEEKELHADALRYNKQAYEYARRADVPSVEIYALRDIGRSYSDMNKNKEAIPYYKRAANIAKSMNDAYLYNMVMEELASIYMEEDMLDEAYRALSAPFSSSLSIDLASHYFIWATYYEYKGISDSVIAYNKRGMLYGDVESNKIISLNLARLYDKLGFPKESMKYYESYLMYDDSLTSKKRIEYDDFVGFVEKNLDFERENTRLAEDRNKLAISVLALVIFIAISAHFAMRFYYKRKKLYEDQQERANRYWKDRQNLYMSNIRDNEKRIILLENELESAGKELTEMHKKLIKVEMDLLDKQNESIILEQRHKDLLIMDLESSDIYRKYHKYTNLFSNDDLRKLKEALNVAYDRFTLRLEELYPPIRYDELYICCLVKIKLSSKAICTIMGCRANNLSMTKIRLYKKIFKKKGSVFDFDDFIRHF